MGLKKKILVITDDNAPIRQMAGDIVAIIGDYPDYQAEAVQVKDFAGIELLPTCAFFLGCGQPKPFSFAYLEDMLKHINLAGRPCGIFSSNKQSLKYLSVLLRPSEAALGEPLLANNGAIERGKLQNWIQRILDCLQQTEGPATNTLPEAT